MMNLIQDSAATQLAIGKLLKSAVERDISDLRPHQAPEGDEVSPKTFKPVRTSTASFLDMHPEFRSAFNQLLGLAEEAGAASQTGTRALGSKVKGDSSHSRIKVSFGSTQDLDDRRPKWRYP